MSIESSAVAATDLLAYRQRPTELQRVDDLLALVPPGVRAVLDVGARDGHLSRLLADRGLQVTALDLAQPQIDDDRIRCVAGDVTALVFGDGEFDLVLCAEVLEHIPPDQLARACSELQRVAAPWLIIGVPYRQDTRFGRTTCSQCGRCNPPWGHVNQFDERRLESLFGACRLQTQTFIGQAEMGTNALAAALMDAAGNPYGTYSQEEPCTHCGATLMRPPQRTLLKKLFTRAGTWARQVQAPFHREHANWIHQLLGKTEALEAALAGTSRESPLAVTSIEQRQEHPRLISTDVPPQVELEDSPCPLGCAPDDAVVMTGLKDRLHNLPGRFRLMRCRQCGLMRTNPRPTPATIGYYYPDDYGPYHSNGTASALPAGQQTLVQQIVRRFFDEGHTQIPSMPVGRVLEVGCASGRFLAELRDRGWEAHGIEFNAEAAARARAAGFPVHTGQREQAPPPDQPYDLVVGWMVLEHLHEPVATLRKLHEWTRPGAFIALSVPDCGAWEISAFRKHWNALHIPNHLYHFNKRTLANVLESAGWVIQSATNHRDLWPARHSIIHLLDDPQAVGPVARILLQGLSALLDRGWIWRPLARVMAPLGQTGCMTVIARRSDS